MNSNAVCIKLVLICLIAGLNDCDISHYIDSLRLVSYAFKHLGVRVWECDQNAKQAELLDIIEHLPIRILWEPHHRPCGAFVEKCSVWEMKMNYFCELS